jgi:peptidyl-prolyl cis-trans isomerase C
MFHIARRIHWGIILLILALAACSRSNPAPAIPTGAASAAPVEFTPVQPPASATPFAPSPTPEPLAAKVNGEGLSLVDYQADLGRFQAAQGKDATPEEMKQVLNDLVDEVLLAQGAAEAGFSLDEAALQERFDQLTKRMGGSEVMAKWQASNGYSEASFRRELARSIAAAWMRDKIANEVPQSADQVHARQILHYNSDQANAALAQLKNGKDFAALAAETDPVTEGELGWFPRGYLPDPKLDEAAFSLQPGQFSEVIQTASGYCILQVIERDSQRLLDPDARLALQVQAVQRWLNQRRTASTIQVLLP